MSFHVSSWSIKNPVPTIVLFLILSIVGFFSFRSMGIDQQPNIDISAVQVTIAQPGAGPQELETQVTKKVEDAVAGLGNIEDISSTVSDGRSTTVINFTLGTDSNEATNDVRNSISQIRTSLPQDINEPIVQRLEFASGSIMTYAVQSEKRSLEELSDLVDRTIARSLLTVKGVAQVERVGGVDREIRVDLDPARLQAYGITATQVNDQIRAFNVNLPGGRAEIGGSEQNVRTLGSAKTLEDLQGYLIKLPNGDTVPLTSLGKVEDGSADARQAAFLNGKPVVGFSVLRSQGSTLVTVADGVTAAVEELKKTLPQDVKLELTFTRATAIRETYKATIDSIWIGCLLTVIVVGVFLLEWRVTLITALALPLSMIPTFLVMKTLGYTLNGMTLLGLALAIGNLVDDAICMVENIDQHAQMGKSPYRAAWDAAREIGLAVVATTATIVAVFLPVAFMGGVPGQFFQPFGVTVAVSTMFSTLVATTVTPMLSAYWLKPKKEAQNRGEEEFATSYQHSHIRRSGPYRTVLTWALRHRIVTLLIAIAFFIGSLQLIPFIPKGLFNSGDTGVSTVMVELPPGSTLDETTEVMQELNRKLQANPAVDRVLARATSVNAASVFVNLVPKEQRIHQREFEKQMRTEFASIPGARLAFRSGGGGGSAKDVTLVLKGENPESLRQTSDALEKQMREIPGLVEVSSSLSLVKPEIVITPDPQRAADLGVSVQAIARTASLALIGDSDSNLAKFNLSDRQIPIRIKIATNEREKLETLENLRVPGANGSLVPISAVADIRLGSGPAEIKRFNRSRQVTLEGNLDGLSLGSAMSQIRALPAMKSLPADVSEESAGDAKIMRDVFTRFGTALGFAIISIYAILVLLYNNFLYPLAILSALPLSVGGALLGLMVAQKELALFALIGIVLLMGLVTKNAILLVDFALAAEQEGMPQFKAVVQAGVSRLRPILMTSLSTVAGMVPIALEIGADGEVRSPMAIAVIGGFSTSTLLTLIVVPVLFTYIDNFVHWLGRKLGDRQQQEERAAREENGEVKTR
ncbi:efflux RND transporter permease subunit [Oscillatoria sp. FACHB-1406]|uniref:efflux RND transporter permease subunit n=1 Tax=Oscillatoria sp. FACHB-1406 TaxID=2692846 RepID=UPI001688B6B1|nr:efflux RND transporter permease subunit [Oscillatoria sp. FACHB-1406]MBD2579836.1 efflux RND transporter permease subunit [Oscillatoria sp. FACHB-1406]